MHFYLECYPQPFPQAVSYITSAWILSHINGISSKCDWRVFANYLKVLAVIQSNKQKFIQESYTDTLNHLIQNVVDYVF